MKSPSFIIGSGYCHTPGQGWQPWFHRLWWRTNIAPLNARALYPRHVFIIRNGQCALPMFRRGEWINLEGNLGGCGDILEGRKDVFMPGEPASWMALAWLAYSNESDFIFIEQDALAFGDWVGQLYRDIGDKGATFASCELMGGATSLFLIRHHYIPIWCHDYLADGRQNCVSRLSEAKWKRLFENKPHDYANLSFGYDRDRPFNIDDPVWYAQKFTPLELLQLREHGLISFVWLPREQVFSNHQ